MPPVNTLSTITVQNVIDVTRQHMALKSLLGVGGITNEPGMSIANDILQFLLAKPRAWKFNRKTLPFFMTQPFVQDYIFAGACAFTLAGATAANGGVGIDLALNNGITQSGSTITVVCLQSHNFQVGETVFLNNVVDQSGNLVAALNALLTTNQIALTSTWSNGFVITAVPTSTTFQFSLAPPISISGAPGITDFGWLENAALTDVSNPSLPLKSGPIKALARITPTSLVGEPAEVCSQQDLGTGVMVFRVNPCAGSYSMAVTCGYQARARVLKTPGTLWSPWPDNLGYVLRSGFKAYAFDLTDKPEVEKQRHLKKFYADVESVMEFDDSEEDNIGFAPSMGIMRG